ncbi:hypothetical protein [Flaviflagellibacter deserti]|uniref:Cyclase dehydrase n=1 Tax=Flaviflagellibacter deserti TaxID=2267266 RepID=A0ABV9Z595_9HYPH
MNALANLSSHIARSPGDPKIVRSGPSSLSGADRLARALGWFSIGLGIVEVIAPGAITRTLGLQGKESLVRAYGVREIASAIPTLSFDKQVGLVSRVAGDLLDVATLAPALRPENPKRDNAAIAMALIAGITLLDIAAVTAVSATHSAGKGRRRDYSDRSGFPKGKEASRGLARESFQTPRDMRADLAPRPRLEAIEG